MCADCGNRRGPLAPRSEECYPSGAQVLFCKGSCGTSAMQAATGVIAAAMEHGYVTPAQIAYAEESAGLLFHPEQAKDIADAARKQARAEMQAELRQARQDCQSLDWFHARWQSVQRLVLGRPDTHLMLVSEILAATDPARPAGAPLRLSWDGIMAGPSGDTDGENTLVPCTTEYGTQATLVLDDERRLELGEQLLATLHTAEACSTPGCGVSASELDASDPSVWGWICVEVAGSEGGPRWWCNSLCVNSAMAAARTELAAADQLTAVDPDARIPYAPAWSQFDVETVARCCNRCGCTEDRACQGGCHWLPNPQHIDLCSACATPQELAYAAGAPQDGWGATS